MTVSSVFKRAPTKTWLILAAAGALGLAASSASAQDFGGFWPSSTFGALHLRQEGDEVHGRYDFKGGRLRGHYEGERTLAGVWTQDWSDHRCHEERMGSHYWGRFEFHLNHEGDGFHGRWGYCDESPDRDWDASR